MLIWLSLACEQFVIMAAAEPCVLSCIVQVPVANGPSSGNWYFNLALQSSLL